MCVAFLALGQHQEYSLILAANRDEFYKRSTKKAHFWENAPHVLAGRDLEAGGTWMGVTLSGSMALLTNFREAKGQEENLPSRGELVRDYLLQEPEPKHYLDRLQKAGSKYSGFSLLFGRGDELYYFSNRDIEAVGRLQPGIHGLSNAGLNSPWPKVELGKGLLAEHLRQEESPDPAALQNLLSRRDRFQDQDLPDTGVGLELERFLSQIFILGHEYGTRASSILLLDQKGGLFFQEKSFKPFSAPGRGYCLRAESVEYRFLCSLGQDSVWQGY
ncbi:MAG: NRDE family protein [Thermodesulfobacteriota bacterium]